MTSLDKTPGIGAPRQAPPPQELELLREEINAFDEKRRLDAVRRLGALHDTRAVPDLVGRMHIDSSPAVRKAAIEALYAINDPQGWPEIAKVLGIDASPDVRIKAVEILALSSDQTQMTAIVRALKDNNQAVRLKAAELLGTTGDRGQANALVNALQDESRQVRQQAAISIGKLQNVSVVPQLIAGLAQADGTRNVNFETDHIEALVQLGSQASAKGAVARGIADSAKACSVPSGGYQPDRVSGSFVLQAVTLERYQRTSYELTSFYENRISILAHLQSVEFSYSDPPPVLVVVTRAMARIKDPTYVDALCRIALQYSEPALRWLALCSLQDLRATNAGDTLQKVLQDDDWIVRKKVAEVLGELRISAAGDLLCRKALSDSNQFVRHQSIRTLGQLEIVTAIPTLSEVVRRSSDDLARVLAVWALGQIKSEQAVSPLASSSHATACSIINARYVHKP